jgi:hypothetical protein
LVARDFLTALGAVIREVVAAEALRAARRDAYPYVHGFLAFPTVLAESPESNFGDSRVGIAAAQLRRTRVGRLVPSRGTDALGSPRSDSPCCKLNVALGGA